MDEFFSFGSPYCLLCAGECDQGIHDRYNMLVEEDNRRQMEYGEMLRREKEHAYHEDTQGKPRAPGSS